MSERRFLSRFHQKATRVASTAVLQPGVKLFRRGAYPPLCGTLLTLDEREQVLYTRGSVEFFGSYPGM